MPKYTVYFQFDEEIRDYVWDHFHVTDTGLDLLTNEYEMIFNTSERDYQAFVEKYGDKLKK
jgi:hypothetical protein